MPAFFVSLEEAVRTKQVALIPSPEEEKSPDWHGMGLSHGFSKALAIAGYTPVELSQRAADAPAVGKLFWKAFLRGGVQAGVWVLDSLAMIESDEGLKEEMLCWLS
jgi:hypothetical protein